MKKTFYTKKIESKDIKSVIQDIGFDKSYLSKITDKFEYSLFKIHNLSAPQASIIKQLALSIGSDAAVHREVITCKVEKSDVLIGGSHRQIKDLCKKLKRQPFSLPALAEEILEQLSLELKPLTLRGKTFDWTKKTYLMGILNVTPDSFSDGGQFNTVENAIAHAKQMIDDGADIIDIGGESTRPMATKVEVDEELNRVIPVIKALREFNCNIVISIDTRNAETAKQAIEAGADIINDVSGFDWDENMLSVAVETQAPVVIMHSLSDPQTMQINPEYSEDIIGAIYKKLSDKIDIAIQAGVKLENIIVDPGIGFGKTLEHNYEIVRRVKEFTSLGFPLLVGVSRKSLISKIIDTPLEEREEANIALNSILAMNGANIIRIHDIKKHAGAFKVIDYAIK